MESIFSYYGRLYIYFSRWLLFKIGLGIVLEVLGDVFNGGKFFFFVGGCIWFLELVNLEVRLVNKSSDWDVECCFGISF